MCRGRMKIFLAGRKRRSFVRALVHERGLRQIAGQRQILVLNVSQDVNLGWLAAIQRSTKSKKSFASATISSASVWVASEAWS
jgi:hypothetical protein